MLSLIKREGHIHETHDIRTSNCIRSSKYVRTCGSNELGKSRRRPFGSVTVGTACPHGNQAQVSFRKIRSLPSCMIQAGPRRSAISRSHPACRRCSALLTVPGVLVRTAPAPRKRSGRWPRQSEVESATATVRRLLAPGFGTNLMGGVLNPVSEFSFEPINVNSTAPTSRARHAAATFETLLGYPRTS
jgi:hypothetical protein